MYVLRTDWLIRKARAKLGVTAQAQAWTDYVLLKRIKYTKATFYIQLKSMQQRFSKIFFNGPTMMQFTYNRR